MTKSKNRLVSWMLLLTMMVALLASAIPTHAILGNVTGDPYTQLVQVLVSGQYQYGGSTTGTNTVGAKSYDYSGNRYALSSGGYLLYIELWNQAILTGGTASQGVNLFIDDFENLKSGERQKFLKDVFTLANAVASDTAHGVNMGVGAPTDDTVTDLMNVMQQQSGLAATMLATLLQNTKPDYVAANRLYEPFSGVVGTILGVIAVLLMAALGVTMALDLAYITIPAFQMALGGTNEGGHGDKSKGIGGIISQEAKKAVQAADGGSGGQAGSGEYRAAVGIYFKYRWKGLVLLGVCLLYLVQGQIYSFVAWFIDLFSGFLGF